MPILLPNPSMKGFSDRDEAERAAIRHATRGNPCHVVEIGKKKKKYYVISDDHPIMYAWREGELDDGTARIVMSADGALDRN